MIDTGSTNDVLFWDAFQKLKIYPNDFRVFNGPLIGLSGKHVQVRGHVTLKTTCGEGANTKVIDVSYLIVDALSPYNIVLGRPSKNEPGAVNFTLYLVLKYPLPRG